MSVGMDPVDFPVEQEVKREVRSCWGCALAKPHRTRDQTPRILARTLVLTPVAGSRHSQLHQLWPQLVAVWPLVKSNHRVEQEYNTSQHVPFL
jgi:hypothetical protein